MKKSEPNPQNSDDTGERSKSFPEREKTDDNEILRYYDDLMRLGIST